jgi:hypothetical protein
MQEAKRTPDNDATTMCKTMANHVIMEAHGAPEKLKGLSEETIEARRILMEAVSGIGQDALKFEELSIPLLKSVREWKGALVVETRQAITAMRDMRAFVSEAKHDKELCQLKEFVDLCERIEKLRTNGTLGFVVEALSNA